MTMQQNIQDLKRFQQLLYVLFKNEMGLLISKMRLKDHLTLQERLEKDKLARLDTQPVRIRMVLEEMGASFTKLGQLLSLRPDMIPKEYSEEFGKLRDRVKPFPSDIAIRTIQDELKVPLEDVFTTFNPEPLAAASIGQVHDATLNKGEQVVIKVQRPKIDQLMRTDIDIMYYFARLLQSHYPEVSKFINPVEIVREFERYTEAELNYMLEVKHIEHFYRNFQNHPNVKIPKPYLNFSTRRVIVMEKIEGIPILDIRRDPKYDKKLINKILTDSIMKQVFIDGYFHADPHPGNIFVLGKDRIAFLDFGIVGIIDDRLKESITKLFIGMIQGNLDIMAEALVNLDIVDQDTSLSMLKKDLYDAFAEYHNTTVNRYDMAEIFHKFIALAKKHNITFSKDFILLGKTMITLQGVSKELDPDYNIVAASKPFVEQLVRQKLSPREIWKKVKKSSVHLAAFIQDFPEKTSLLLRRMSKADEDLQAIDRDIKSMTVEIDKSSNRVTYGLLIASLIVAAAITLPFNAYTIAGYPALSFIAIVLALILSLMLIISIAKERKLF
ncbi:AarF/ABC1/UbiB kinase family protein [Candidatus Woesearchaeota archaeon]|nr:AarF/ABC1/UbiB kinase family protein [Candidatus Woesearchaeota archaeon]